VGRGAISATWGRRGDHSDISAPIAAPCLTRPSGMSIHRSRLLVAINTTVHRRETMEEQPYTLARWRVALDPVLGSLLPVPRPKGQKRVSRRGSQGTDHWGC
jgi:hypothetical protein